MAAALVATLTCRVMPVRIEDVEQRASDAGDKLNRPADHASQERLPAALDVGREALRHGERDERRQPDRHQHQGLVGHEVEEGEDDQRGGAVPAPNFSTTLHLT